MKPTLWTRLDHLGRQLLPAIVTFTLLVISAVPLRLPPLQVVTPSLALIAVYFWTMYRPDLMPAAAAFAFGLMEDIVTGAPLGVGALVFVAVHAMVRSQRTFFAGKPFAVIWLGFALTAAIAFFMAWLVVCLFYVTLINGMGVVFEAAVTISCMPLVWWLLVRAHGSLLRQA